MQVSIAFRHMDPSPAVQEYASKKLHNVVSKYVAGMDVDSKIVFSTERFHHIANFTISINGLTVKCVEKTEDMYSSIDLALDKVERQMRRYKSKIRSHRPDGRRRSFTHQVIPAAAGEPDSAEAADAAPAATQAEEAAKVEPIKTKQMEAPFMTANEAIVQLELRHANFFVYTNRETERINIVYRRDDGDFGLIEAEPAHA